MHGKWVVRDLIILSNRVNILEREKYGRPFIQIGVLWGGGGVQFKNNNLNP